MSARARSNGVAATIRQPRRSQNLDDNSTRFGLESTHEAIPARRWAVPPRLHPEVETMRQRLSLALAFGLGLAFADPASAQIKLGVAGPLTGGSAAFGAQLKNGTEQAGEDTKGAGGNLRPKNPPYNGGGPADPQKGGPGAT